MATILKEEDSVSYQIRKTLPYKTDIPTLRLQYIGESKMMLPNRELIQIRSFLNKGIMISSSLTVFLASMTLFNILEESISVPLFAISSAIVIAFIIERKRKKYET